MRSHYPLIMRRIGLYLLLFLVACEAAGSAVGGTTGEDPTVTAAESSSSGVETDDEEGSSGGESSSGGSVSDPWNGEAVALRTVDGWENGDCDRACGASVCLHAEIETTGDSVPCYQEGGTLSCTCGDFAPAPASGSTHAISGCWLGPNVGDPDGFMQDMPDRWYGDGTCDDWCDSEGLGACGMSIWTDGWDCPPTIVQESEFRWTVDFDGSVQKPESVVGEGGVLRFVCEL